MRRCPDRTLRHRITVPLSPSLALHPRRRRLLVAGVLGALAAGVLVACSSSSEPTAPPAERRWTLVWSDEFDGPAGERPSAASWTSDIGTGWGNGQLEYDTDRATNAALDGAGNLVITARRESLGGREYTSARLTTAGKREFRYGKIEARMRLAGGRGLWPAFWMLGTDYATAGWPASGEIDIVELRGHEANTVLASVHGPGYSGGNSITRRHTVAGARFDLDFHVFAVEWTADRVEWFLDGTRYHTVRRADVPGAWPFDKPFYLILNVAVGGTLVGPPDASTTFPRTMAVDWVRVYAPETAIAPATRAALP
jgi:beta-glucanase (GH16 family)